MDGEAAQEPEPNVPNKPPTQRGKCRINKEDESSDYQMLHLKRVVSTLFPQMEHGVGLNAAILRDLTPNWEYVVKVRCRTAQHSWKWGDWSEGLVFHTEGDGGYLM